jgi:hypothetical protein
MNQKIPYKIIPKEYQCKGWFCRLFSHWLNPFGNWNEPLPYPKKRKIQADESWIPNCIWWNLRNPFHNFTHYWIGIVPLGKQYEWYTPEYSGWVRYSNTVIGKNYSISFWKKGFVKLPIINYNNGKLEFYIGWMSRGNFGIALRNSSKSTTPH